MRRRPVGRVLLLTLAGIIGVFAVWTNQTRAAAFPLIRDYLNRQEANLTSGLVHQVFFTAATNLPGSANLIRLRFPDANDGAWCRTAGADLTVIGLVNPSGATESATMLPSAPTATCTIGSGPGSWDTIIINNVGPLTGGQKYGVQITDGSTAKLGTPGPAVDINIDVATNNGAIDVDTGQIHTAILNSDEVSISAVVAAAPPASNPVVEFRGRASPAAALTITRDSVTIHSSVLGSDASFDVILSDQPVGQHVYELAATDSVSRLHPPITVATSLTLGSTTLISNIFFGPTIAVAPNQVTAGAGVTISGLTVPNATVSLDIQPGAQSHTATASAAGAWTFQLDTTNLAADTYDVTATAVAPDTAVSESSQSVSFAVSAPGTTTPPNKCDGKKSSDTNCDGKINLIDFSIMLFYWGRAVEDDNRSDMNHDGKVDIVDFSILLYQWTGF